MCVVQIISTRYVDKQKLYALLDQLFAGQPHGVEVRDFLTHHPPFIRFGHPKQNKCVHVMSLPHWRKGK